MRLHPPRDSTTPSVCFADCNNAVIELQSVGKSSACEPGSAFLDFAQACNSCIDAYSSDIVVTTGGGQDTWITDILNYCDSPSSSEAPSSSQGATTSTSQASITSIPGPLTSSAPSSTPSIIATVTVIITYTTTIDGLKTVWTLTTAYTSFAPVPDVGTITIPTIQNGRSTDLIFTKTYTHIPSSLFFNDADNTSTTTTVLEPDQTTTPFSTPNSQRSQAWIAGPAVGGVAGLLILLLVTWFLLRIRRRRASRKMGSELHGESALKAELEVEHKPQELEAPVLDRKPSELPAEYVERS